MIVLFFLLNQIVKSVQDILRRVNRTK